MHFPAIQIISFPKIQIKDGSRQVRAKKAKGDGNKPSHLCKADFGILLEILLAIREGFKEEKKVRKNLHGPIRPEMQRKIFPKFVTPPSRANTFFLL